MFTSLSLPAPAPAQTTTKNMALSQGTPHGDLWPFASAPSETKGREVAVGIGAPRKLHVRDTS